MKFIREVMAEMKRVVWPSKPQLRRDSSIVIQTSVLFAVLFFLMDTVVQTALQWILG